MRYLPHLFENNRAWAASQIRTDARFFDRLCEIQKPDYLWIGCSDSRVPANEVVGLAPGELFVHRNVGNVVPAGDLNVLSVLQYAVDTLGVKHVIVCGHYSCGGVAAAMSGTLPNPLNQWIAHIRRVAAEHERELSALPDDASRVNRLCELNVRAQVKGVCATETIQNAWARAEPVTVHGWIYDLKDGLLRDLDVSVSGSHS